MMEAFIEQDGVLQCAGHSLESLAEQYGSPLYVYNGKAIKDRYQGLKTAMSPAGAEVFFAVKANSNLSILRLLAEQGAGMEVVSGGELYRARTAGVEDARIVFDGVGKTEAEIRYALEGDLRFFAVESIGELERLNDLAGACGNRARVSLRINPDIDPQTHRYISTGKSENKFGFDFKGIRGAYDRAEQLENLEVVGLHMHIGSQILSNQPHAQAVRKIRPLVEELQARFPSFRYLDIGGGLGIRYKPEDRPLDPARFAEAILPQLAGLDLDLMLEPGRYLVGDCGALVTRVEYIKQGGAKRFVVSDAAMNDLMRPMMYQAYHEIVPVRSSGTQKVAVDVVGAICETGDFFAEDRPLETVEAGQYLAVLCAGAYAFTMASNYNTRPRGAEVLVDEQGARLIRRRETWADLVAAELPYVDIDD
jgi:diaminopimelate decarboxylase